MWAEYELTSVHHNGYITNNHLESTHQKIDLTKSTIIVLISALLQIASDKRGKAEQLAAKMKFKNQIQQTSNSAYLSVVQAINTSLPPTPASLVTG